MPEPNPLSIGGRLFVGLQHWLPQHALSNAMFWLTRRRLPLLMPWVIRLYVRLFGVDLGEAADPDPRAYPTFNAFFTRPLRTGARPAADAANAIACPVDGRVSAAGEMPAGRLLQAKGQTYSLESLVAGDAELANLFRDGHFATLYLSPSDYHRVHMPVDGRLTRTIQVPGRLFSVNPTTVAGVPQLFARNERVICLFETAVGPMALILVGAIFVGSIETVWAGRITPPRIQTVTVDEPGPETVRLPRGAEVGRFNMGSTVILLFCPGAVQWNHLLTPGAHARCGSEIGQIQTRAREHNTAQA